MSRDLLDLVRELNTLNDDNLADRVIENSDVQWCLSELQDILEEMPTLTPPNEWVSVDERLPRLRENVLVCAYWHEHWGVYMGWNSGHGWSVSCGLGQRSDVQVSHWMPLPEPPGKEG